MNVCIGLQQSKNPGGRRADPCRHAGPARVESFLGAVGVGWAYIGVYRIRHVVLWVSRV